MVLNYFLVGTPVHSHWKKLGALLAQEPLFYDCLGQFPTPFQSWPSKSLWFPLGNTVEIHDQKYLFLATNIINERVYEKLFSWSFLLLRKGNSSLHAWIYIVRASKWEKIKIKCDWAPHVIIVIIFIISGAPQQRKFGHLSIREILVITWPYIRPSNDL